MKQFVFLATLCLSLSPFMSRAAEVHLVTEGQPKALLVLGDGVKPHDAAVQTLRSRLREISDAELKSVAVAELGAATVENGRVVVPAGNVTAENFVLIGESALTKQLGLSLDGIGVGGIVVKTTENALVLMGRNEGANGARSDANTSAAVRFLETLGCRQLWPGPGGRVVPMTPNVTAPVLDIRFTPKIAQRKIRMQPEGPRNFEQGLAWLDISDADHEARMTKALAGERLTVWGVWNGLGGDIGIRGGHAGCGLRGGWEQHGKAHPEWFALQVDGTRDQTHAGGRWRICESNPELREHVAQDILLQLDGKAQPPISLSPNDGGNSSFCQCDKCKALDPADAPRIRLMLFDKVGESKRTEIEYPSLTDRQLNYWNDIVARVTTVVPDQQFIVDAYSVYSDAPVREKLHPNLILRYVPKDVDGWNAWKAAGARRIYWRPNNLHSGYRDGIISPNARETAATIRALAEGGMLATDMQGIYNNWAVQGLDYYVAARVTWDPALAFEAVLDDYARSGFGAGAEHVKEFWLLADRGIEPRQDGSRGDFPTIRPGTLEAMRAALIAAAKATVNDAPSQHRTAFLRAGFEFTAINAEAHALAEAAETSGTKPDLEVVTALMERRWQMMRAIYQRHPLAVNFALVAAYDSTLNRALGWKGPGASAKAVTLQLSADDDWLYEDQSALRK